LLITPHFGSYVLLGEILTDLEVDIQPLIVPDHCGDCHACIDACPTRCLRDDRTLQADHCIAYLTTEHKGSIPRTLRPQIENWVLGCDVCQLVCPWNENKCNERTIWQEFISFPTNNQGDIIKTLGISEAEFKSQYSHTPIGRLKRSRLLRNAAVALGNSIHLDDEKVILHLIQQETDPLIREHLYWALGKCSTVDLSTSLRFFLDHETDPHCLEELQFQLKNH